MPNSPEQRNNASSLMSNSRDGAGASSRQLRPGDDGWKTPTIEDEHHPANRQHGSTLCELSLARHFEGLRRRRSLQLQRVDEDIDVPSSRKLPWSERVRHVTWAWFTMTMATGGIANVLVQGWW
jgi:hypothetical protein